MNVINDIRSRARLRDARPAQTAPPARKPLAVAPGHGSYSLDAAAAILRISPERLRAHTRNQATSDHGEFFSEEELRQLWPVFRK
jgi:hypothetical protein